MKQLFFLLSLTICIASCSGSGEKRIISIEKKVVTPKLAKVTPNDEMTVQIEGMSCEHACGGAIRMALKKTNAVDRCSFVDFNAENEANEAKITFDNTKISRDQIISIIETTNDGQFTAAQPAKSTEKKS
jgi:copper chaperone CopZ